ncbi:septum site-determining protein MinC [Paracoccus sp. NGMCC 1.201697]|uniref:Probable septum site-determining protein MinC n=1 Tax=Paracoccus broussonetiae subsp. drimophilus TaxID=3373869 RepID=A0ABW7LGJ3_9RHOB
MPTQKVATVKPVQIRGRFFTAVALHLSGPADRDFLAALDAKLHQTPLFFENAPLVIDLEHAQGLDGEREMVALASEMRSRRLSVFGIQNGSPAQVAAAAKAGLIALPGGRNVPLDRVTRTERPSVNAAAAATTPEVEKEAAQPITRTITQPIRSGQTVFADRGDLIVLGPVSSGAEIIAAGNIHVYGRLRGRALAGVNGDTSARIFCHSLDAELLAIAGLYRTSENLGADIPREHVQVCLEGEKLRVLSLK